MKNVFSHQMITLRRRKHLSQSDLANKLYVSRQSISKWENGDAEPDIDKLIRLSEILNISLDGLLAGKVGDRDLLLAIEHVSKSFQHPVLKDVHLQIFGNERIALLGDNGAGKSTLLKILVGMLKPDQGRVDLKFDPHTRLSLMTQSDVLIDDLKVHEMIALTASIDGAYSKAKIANLLTQFKLSKQSNIYVSQLSGGQKRRLSLLLSLIRSSKLLILDEPTVGMDLDSIDLLWHYLDHVPNSIIMVTHDFNQIDKFFSRVILLKDGQVWHDESVDKIHSHNQTIEQWYRINNGGDKND